MKRSLAAGALAAAPLLALGTTTAAATASTQHVVDSGCTNFADYTYCYNFDYRVTQTLTPSGNSVYSTTGTNSYDVSFVNGGGYGDSYDFDLKFIYKKGQPQVSRTQAAHTYYYGDSSCTDLTNYKFTNGKVQVETYETICNF